VTLALDPTTLDPIIPDPTPTGGPIRWLFADAWLFTRRHLAHIRQIPEKLLDVTVQPIMFVLLFAYVFGGAIGVPGGNYREYLIGGILVQSLAFGLVGPANSIATDLNEGVIDRFRSLPTSRAAYLLGHFFAESIGMILAISILTGSGLIVGWRTHSSVLAVAGGFVLLLLFAMAMVIIGTLVGMSVRSPDAVTGVAFIGVFPLTFLSNAFVPLDTLPAGLRVVASWNPISTMVTATRDLFGNPVAPTAHSVWTLDHATPVAAVSCLLLILVFSPLALRRFQRRTAD
jgi:ABC transporter DrrB family efflux protein